MKAVFVGAHNDDCEYNAGGMAYLLHEKGFEIYFLKVACKRRQYKKHGNLCKSWLDPAACEEYSRQDIEAARILGAQAEVIAGYGNDYYVASNENIQLLRDAIEKIMPDIAFIHWNKDNHWEHVEASKAAFQVLCEHAQCEVHAFEAGPWQSMIYMQPDYLIDITSAMEKIDQSLMTFDQPSASGAGLVREKHAAAEFRGYMSGCKYAEAYKILRYPSPKAGTSLLLPNVLGDLFRWGGYDQYPAGIKYYL